MAQEFAFHISAAKVPTIKTAATVQGIDLTKSYGTLPEHHGVVLEYAVHYINDGDAVVMFTIKSKPFYVTVDMVQSGVKELLGL